MVMLVARRRSCREPPAGATALQQVLASVPTELWELILDGVVAPTGAFVVSGAHGYAEGINGTYQPVRYRYSGSPLASAKLIEEFHDGYDGLDVGRDPRIIYRQLENPMWRFKRLAACDEAFAVWALHWHDTWGSRVMRHDGVRRQAIQQPLRDDRRRGAGVG